MLHVTPEKRKEKKTNKVSMVVVVLGEYWKSINKYNHGIRVCVNLCSNTNSV